jgi:Icc-related predicted phosphoesterase
MKIALASDIHLEFGDITLVNDQGADVLILAGDICLAVDANNATPMGRRVQAFFQRVSHAFPRVIYIMGNHEHYDGDYARSHERLQKMLDGQLCNNVTLLDKDTVVVDDVTFVGGTFWTDFDRENPLAMLNASNAMNDYRVCRNSATGYSGGGYASRLQPVHTLADHRKCHDYICIVTEPKDLKFVVVTHHAPSRSSVDVIYENDDLMNANFYSEQTEFILDRPQIKLWVHGHMHNNSDYMIGTTRVACNPRGYYGHERRADMFKLEYFDV